MQSASFQDAIQKMPLSANQHKMAKVFFEQYEIQNLVNPADKPVFLGDATKHTCRFCGLKTPVTFRSLAHLIPDFMGNRNIASHFECDACNNWFSRYETSFANYFGIGRTFSQIPGKNGTVPSYEDAKKGIEVSVGEKALELKLPTGLLANAVNRADKSLTLATTRPGYVPLHIIKVLLKIGLALLPEEELVDFEWVRHFLLSTEYDYLAKGDPRFQLYLQFIPGPPRYPAPHAQLFTRRVEHTDLVFEKQVILYYASYIMQLVLPSRLDMPRLSGKQVSVPIFPALITQEWQQKYGTSDFHIMDFSDSKTKRKEPHVLSFSFGSFTKMSLMGHRIRRHRRPPSAT